MTELFAELDSYRELDYRGWDAEDADPIGEAVILRAKAFCVFVREAADAFWLQWEDPSPAPTCNGGINLHWGRGSHHALLGVSGITRDVECVTQTGKGPGHILVLPEEEAACLALWALAEGAR